MKSLSHQFDLHLMPAIAANFKLYTFRHFTSFKSSFHFHANTWPPNRKSACTFKSSKLKWSAKVLQQNEVSMMLKFLSSSHEILEARRSADTLKIYKEK